MNNETKNEIKKNVATGASTAAGATVGIVIGAAVTPNSAEAAEVITSQPDTPVTPTPNPKPEPAPEPDPIPNPTPEPEPDPEIEPEIEVLGYDRVTNDDGSQMDIAIINNNGYEVGVIDVDLDGEADALVCDLNQNGVLEEGEIEIVQGQGYAMQPLQDAAGFNLHFTQNNLPDYVNDADMDPYMA